MWLMSYLQSVESWPLRVSQCTGTPQPSHLCCLSLKHCRRWILRNSCLRPFLEWFLSLYLWCIAAWVALRSYWGAMIHSYFHNVDELRIMATNLRVTVGAVLSLVSLGEGTTPILQWPEKWANDIFAQQSTYYKSQKKVLQVLLTVYYIYYVR